MKNHKYLKKESKINKKMLIIRLVQLIFLILIIFSSIKIYNWYNENKANKQILNDLSNLLEITENDEKNKEENKYKINFEELKKKNNDVVAWIKVNNTKIEYPVVKAKDNSYYLNHNFDKSYNVAGWIFADYRNEFNGTEKNIIVYGHNRRDGSMFGSLKNILDKNWYDDDKNRNIIFATEEKVSTYRVFSVYQIEKEDYYIQTEFKENEFEKFIKTLKERSQQDFNEDVNKDSQILTLSTCANNNKYRVVLHAVKVEE